MSTIHQLFCTQESPTSAGPVREPADRVSGVAVDAASLQGPELEQHLRQLEPLLYYCLPRDTTPEQLGQLTASLAPRRLFAASSSNGVPVVGQMCFRAIDGDGRSASFLAHVLVEERSEENKADKRWSPLDCLRLWGADGWWGEGPVPPSDKLAPLHSLDEVLGQKQPAIDDQVFMSFLSTPAAGEFHDPGEVIPLRWRAMDPKKRRSWFLDAFSVFLKGGSERKEPLWIVAEPSVAALIFYGIVRLLPASPVRDGLSFSTFESQPDRTRVALAATWFSHPDPAVSQLDAAFGPDVVNTLVEPAEGTARPRAEYAVGVIRRLLEKGWEEVDWLLETLSAIKARKIEHLDPLAKADRLVAALLETGAFPNQNWRKSPAATAYLRKVLSRELSNPAGLAERVKRVAEGPAALAVLELIAARTKDSPTRPATDYLLKHLPGDKIAGLLKLRTVTSADKLLALARHIEHHGDLPPKCDVLWEMWERAVKARKPAKSGLLPHLLTRLPADRLAKFLKRSTSDRACQAVSGLLALHAMRAIKPVALTPVIDAIEQKTLMALYRKEGHKLLEDYPGDEPAMPRQLGELMRTLPQFPREFRERLEFLLAGQHLLDQQEERVVTAWANFRKGLERVGQLQNPDTGMNMQNRINQLITACREMAIAADEAMSYARFDCENPEARKVDCLKQIAKELLGKPLLPPGIMEHEFLWTKIGLQFQNHQWPLEGPVKKDTFAKGDAGGKKDKPAAAGKKDKDPLAKEDKKAPKEGARRAARSATPSSGWLSLVVVVAMLLIIGLIVWWVYARMLSPGAKSSKGQKKDAIEKRKREKKTVSWLEPGAEPKLVSRPDRVCQMPGERAPLASCPWANDLLADVRQHESRRLLECGRPLEIITPPVRSSESGGPPC